MASEVTTRSGPPPSTLPPGTPSGPSFAVRPAAAPRRAAVQPAVPPDSAAGPVIPRQGEGTAWSRPTVLTMRRMAMAPRCSRTSASRSSTPSKEAGARLRNMGAHRLDHHRDLPLGEPDRAGAPALRASRKPGCPHTASPAGSSGRSRPAAQRGPRPQAPHVIRDAPRPEACHPELQDRVVGSVQGPVRVAYQAPRVGSSIACGRHSGMSRGAAGRNRSSRHCPRSNGGGPRGAAALGTAAAGSCWRRRSGGTRTDASGA
jgi:hypothetical protein